MIFRFHRVAANHRIPAGHAKEYFYLDIRSKSGFWMTVCLLAVFAGRLAADEAATSSQRELDTLTAHITSGQYRLVTEDATRWAAMPDADRELLGKGCALLSNKHVFDAALILLGRLDWRIPSDCYWPSEIIAYMQSKGMGEELDKALTNGTALVPKNPLDADEQKDRWGGYRTAIRPQAADQLFNFYQTNNRFDELCRRYERELVKRPQDVGLVTEFAFGLGCFEREQQAVLLIEGLDLKKLDLLTLIGVGHLWYPPHDPTNLVRCTIKPLELALTRKISDDDAQRFTSGWQMVVGTELGKRLIHERLLEALADRYACIGQLGKAKEKYEAFLALPRREAWGDRTEVQQKYARILKTLSFPDPHRLELETKAQTSGKGTDWAELAAYEQGQGDLPAAKRAWEKAIAVTPPAEPHFKAERPRENYIRQFVSMLDEAKMYAEEITVLKQVLREGQENYARGGTLQTIAQAYLKLGKKDVALAFLMGQPDEQFTGEIAALIIRTDHEKTLFDYHHLSHAEAEKLPVWNKVLARIKALPEPRRSTVLANFYDRYDMYAEYMDLVEAWPKGKLTYSEMSRLMDCAHRCDRSARTVFWGQEVLRHIGEKDFPDKGSREHIAVMEDISEYAAVAGDLDTALTMAKQLCLLVPERFYFAEALAKLAATQGQQGKLISALKQFAAEHPDRWVIWHILAEVQKTFGNQAEMTAAQRQADGLR